VSKPARPRADLERRLRAAAGGDVTAFEELYEAVSPTVYGLTLRILDDVAEAEDVTEEVLLEVWRAAARFDPAQGSALSWVLARAHRAAVDRVRSAAAGSRHGAIDPGEGRPLAGTAASGALGATEVAWGDLPADQRRAVELAYFAGHTRGEIGQHLSLPLGRATSRIRDGLLTLARLLDPDDGLNETVS
jgi:RNA polymerase sigma-70 factor (ECF subfamily)